MPQRSPSLSVGFDVGGTFTDIVVADGSGRVRIEKTLTTPADPAVGARQGIEAALAGEDRGVSAVELGIHGTTLVTNAIIEGRGATTGVLTTTGFEDILEIGGGTRYDMYDLHLPFRAPLVERRLRRGIRERVDHAGAIVTPLDDDDVRAQLGSLVEDGAESVAVCLLHAYVNPAHERRIAEIAAAEHPALAVTLSSDIAAELGEHERLSTTAANAYVMPLMSRYIGDLDAWLTDARLLLMASNGGTISVQTARAAPITMIESGPAAGALAAAEVSRRVGRDRVISFDMGGTTAKISLVDDGEPAVVSEFEAARSARFKAGSGIPLRVPVVNLIEIGAGGGSIARVDELGLLKVGPQSAGADPGPASYGLGGQAPTVTDASLVLGHLDPESFLGGGMTLDPHAARRAIADGVATPLGIDVARAAWGIHALVSESMAGAMRTHVAERNRDARRYTIVAFGGAGPLHAVAVARKVGVEEVVVPMGAGVMSAVGLLAAPPAVDVARSQPMPLDAIDPDVIAATLRGLEDIAAERIATAGTARPDVVFERTVDMRYAGQAHEISVPVPPGPIESAALKAAFERVYAERYTLLNPSFPLEVLAWRVQGHGPRRTVAPVTTPEPARVGPGRTRSAWSPEHERYVDVAVHRQDRLDPDVPVRGPAIFEQPETTTIIGPADVARADAEHTLIISIGRNR